MPGNPSRATLALAFASMETQWRADSLKLTCDI